jgi:Stage II sporulation protein E (SpoIIE)/GAF domain
MRLGVRARRVWLRREHADPVAEAAQREAARTLALATLARHLSVARSFDEVGAAIAEHAAPALDADFAIVGLVTGDRLRTLALAGPHLDVLAPYADLPLDSDFPGLVALRLNDVVTFTSLDAVPNTGVAADLEALGLHAGACAPLSTADGTPLGALTVLWSTPPDFDETLRGRIDTVADLCEQTAERARLFDAEHQITRDLQQRVLAPLPDVPGLAVAARYLPAADAVGMGGDWYDGIALGGDRLCLVVGDVAGHGLDAVAEMVQLRTVVHTLATSDTALPEIVVRTSATLRQHFGSYATMLVAVIDRAAGTVRYAAAGHPPPLLRHPHGRVERLAGGRHGVLGVETDDRGVGEVAFPPGATLIAYTDGLIERRGIDFEVAISRLATQVADAPSHEPGALADHLLAVNPGDDGRTDDVALVIARAG